MKVMEFLESKQHEIAAITGISHELKLHLEILNALSSLEVLQYNLGTKSGSSKRKRKDEK